MMKFLLFLFLLPTLLPANSDSAYERHFEELTYFTPIGEREITADEWQEVAPFLLPDNHPMKKVLDSIFGSFRVSANRATLFLAGFDPKDLGGFSNTVVTTHPRVKGYILKFFTDDQENVNEVRKLTNRAKGANAARAVIEKYGFQDLIKVPRKWIYVMPRYPEAAPNSYPKHFVLLAEKMDIYVGEESKRKWRNKMNRELLNAIYIVITEAGLNDSCYHFNIPFSKDGRIAVIDTEHYNSWPIPYHKLNKYLSSEMLAYWKELTHQ